MNQFLISSGHQTGDDVTLSTEEAHHLRDVQRRKVNETIQVSDGSRSFYAQIIHITKFEVTIRLMNEIKIIKHGSLEIAQALLKGDRLEWIFEKCVELGIDTLQPFTSSRTIAEESSNKRLRWEKIIDAAVKQCGTPTRPTLKNTLSFEKFLKENTADLKILFWENWGVTLKECFGNQPPSPKVSVLIGPEGGFSEEEAALAKNHGFVSVFLGHRILRSETAAIVAASLIQYELGNL